MARLKYISRFPPVGLFTTTILALLSLLLLAGPAQAAGKPKNAILLSEVQSLTLRGKGAKTTARRSAAVPQLKCISSAAVCALHEVDLMRCTNQGAGYSMEDIQWSCTASLPATLKLGSTDVICEGYMSADDDYVLKGSCGVEYRLVLTEEGERRHPELVSGGFWKNTWGKGGKSSFRGDKSGAGGPVDPNEKLEWSGIIFMIIFVSVLAWMLYSACVAAGNNGNPPRNTTRRPRGGGGGGGGGGWGPGGGGGGFGGWGNDDSDPPPPYSDSKPTGSSSSQQGWRPGFFTGAATGAAAAYYAGRRGNQQQQRGYGAGTRGGSSWFGNNGGGSSSSSSYNNNDSGSSSSARYESTGFGSTSRR